VQIIEHQGMVHALIPSTIVRANQNAVSGCLL
jgi:hypothetical protein